jgi:hypothetical protein
MTKLTKARGPYETAARYFDAGAARNVVVTLDPHCAVFRLKRTKQEYCMAWGRLFQFALEASVPQVIHRVKRGSIAGGR